MPDITFSQGSRQMLQHQAQKPFRASPAWAANEANVVVVVAQTADTPTGLVIHAYGTEFDAQTMIAGLRRTSFKTNEDIWVGGDLWGQGLLGIFNTPLFDKPIQILIDGQLFAVTWTNNYNGMPHYWLNIGKLAAGTHTVKAKYVGGE